MKIKLIVTSMSLLGLVSCPTLAAVNDQNPSTVTTTQTKKTISHRKSVKSVKPNDVEYKDAGSLPVKPAPVDVICTISESSVILDGVTQNVGRALPNPCTPGWFNRLAVTGGINVDLGKWGNRNANIMGENYQRLSLNDAYINISAVVNEWARGFASISFNTATINDPSKATATNHFAEFNAAYSNNVISGSNNSLQLEQAFLTLGNFEYSPLYLQAGKQFLDYNRYEIHPITESMTQVMSKTLATSLKLGFIANGFNGSVYVFDDPLAKVGESSKTTNYGAAIGFDLPSDQLGLSVGAAYLHNIIGVNDIAYSVNQFTTNNSGLAHTGGYTRRTAGTAVYADVNSGPFNIGARYTTALQRFSPNDLPEHGVADIDPNTGKPFDDTTGARPWAFGIQAGYGFHYFCDRPQHVLIGYQTSREAAGLNLPKYRWLAAYNIEMIENTNLGIEWDHDTAYKQASGGSGKVSNLVSLRAAIKFA